MPNSGLTGGLTGLTSGFMQGFQLGQQIQDRNRALAAEKGFGDTLRQMYAPGPEPGATTGMPENAPDRGPSFLPPIQPQVQGPVQIPGAMPMPNAGQQPGGMPTPLQPQPQMAPPQQPMPQPQPGPQTMERGAPTARGANYETLPMKQPGNLDWKSFLTTLAQQNPGMKPEVMARIADRALPMMNSQSQMEWRQISENIRQQNLDRQTRQGDERTGIQQQNADTRAGAVKNNKAYHDARLAQINTQLTKAGANKLPAGVKETLGVYTTLYNRTTVALNVAQTNLQKAMYEGSDENKAAAQQDVKDAEEAVRDAQTKLTSYAAKILPNAQLDFGDVNPPTEGAPQTSTRPMNSPPGAAPAAAGNVPLKNGKSAQTGYESIETLVPPEASGPAAMEKPIPNTAPVQQAKPGGNAPAAAPKTAPVAPPNPKDRTANTVYLTPKGLMTWTGTGWLPANAPTQRAK